MTILEVMDKTAKTAVECKHCGHVTHYVVRLTQLKAFHSGENPYDAFPFLSCDECDFIGSNVCTSCRDKGLS